MTYFKEKLSDIIILALCAGIFVVSFALYELPILAVIYPIGLSALILTGYFFYKEYLFRKKQKQIKAIIEELNNLPVSGSTNKNELMLGIISNLPGNGRSIDQSYQEIIDAIVRLLLLQADEFYAMSEDTVDYYTTWVHQIKVPIASMKLNLENTDNEKTRVLMSELVNIEKYVEMVLCYLRLNSDSTDYVFNQVKVLDVVKPEIRKLSSQFIGKGLGIKIEPSELCVLTDEKWLAFVVSQILSNAVKYTNQGGITISCTADSLVISDTGIGIDASDLPMVTKKGYTGINGRTDKTASGLGLYLAGKIVANIGHKLKIESEPNVGTKVYITFSDKQIIK